MYQALIHTLTSDSLHTVYSTVGGRNFFAGPIYMY